MKDSYLYDITEVCRMLQTTSRTLRFYEQKGIIKSTTSTSPRRQYTKEQISLIRNVLVLRTLGLSVKTIAYLQRSNADLRDALVLKRAEIEALIETKIKEITLLNNAIVMMEQDKDIFEQKLDPPPAENDAKLDTIIKKCTKAIIQGDATLLYEHLSDTMKEYMPRSAFERIRADTLAPLGNFVSLDKLEYDKKHPHIAYQFIKYEKLGLKIKYVFYEQKIQGLWLGYYEL
ncbi:MAG: MerR family transcriptional regulator [Clostridia bacterium]|nr:MerR family transcriptional regulator [Clostridia bacterium]